MTSTIERHYRLWLLAIWLASAAAAITVNHSSIAQFRFWDPDDVMRLLEVRDWLTGQSWFDVTQHRMNLPAGLSMHWSRLLDVPLAAIIILLKPLVGQRMAETAASVVVPMLTLGATMSLVAGIARHRLGAGAGLLAAALCLLSVGTWYAMLPMRIDHHGYQLLCGLGIAWAFVTRDDRNGTVIAGLCAAAWCHISLEGLAFTACASAWLGLRWVVDPRPRTQLPLFLASLAIGSVALYVAVHGIGLIGHTFCDQISPVHITVFGLAALLSVPTMAFQITSMGLRATWLAVMGVSCALLYRFGAPQCAAGPFGSLGPLGHDLWYLNVHEGVPLWRAPVETRLAWGIFPWVGLTGALTAALRPDDAGSGKWSYCALLAAATGIGLLVTRAGAFANLLAIPGAVGLFLLIADRSEAWPLTPRALARAGALMLLSPFGAQSTSLLAMQTQPTPHTKPQEQRCGQIDNLAALDRIRAVTILAPLELGPIILAGTHHSAVTGPYHRDPDALEDVLRFFTADEPTAHAIALRRNARLLIFCPAGGEMATMAKFAPAGVAARLLRGQAPQWLAPVALPGTPGLSLYRMLP